MKVFNNTKQLEKYLKENKIPFSSITEEGEKYWVSTDKGLIKFLKPLPKQQALKKLYQILPKRPFKDLVDFLENPIQNKAYHSIMHFLKSKKKALLLTGPTGIGKTTVSSYGIYYLLRQRKISNPLYLCVITDLREEQTHLKVIESDAFIIDDLNLSASKYDLVIARKIILYALEHDYPLFITSNNTAEELTQAIFEQHIRSRIEGRGQIIQIKDEDYRLKKLKQRR